MTLLSVIYHLRQLVVATLLDVEGVRERHNLFKLYFCNRFVKFVAPVQGTRANACYKNKCMQGYQQREMAAARALAEVTAELETQKRRVQKLQAENASTSLQLKVCMSPDDITSYHQHNLQWRGCGARHGR